MVELLDDEMPSYIAMALLTVLNLLQTIILWSILLYYYPQLDAYRTKLSGFLIGVFLLTFNWFTFEYRDRWKDIYDKFKNEKTSNKWISSVATLLYVFFSIWICFQISIPWIIENF